MATLSQTMQALEVKVPPPIATVLFAAAMWLTGHLLPPFHLASQLRFVLVAICVALGLFFAVSGFLAFGKAKTTINPVNPEAASTLVISGVYRITRNPMYVGLTALLVGWAVWLSVPWLLVGPAGFVLFLTRFQIIPEERALSVKFGHEYGEYRKQVRRWL